MALAPSATTAAPASRRIASTQDRIEHILGMSDDDICDVGSGALVLLENPFTHSREVKSPFDCTAAEIKNKIDLGAFLGGVARREWSPNTKREVADSYRLAAQLAPDLVSAAVNAVRRNHDLPPILDADLAEGPFVGTVRSQNSTQTVLADEAGGKFTVFENDALSDLPKVGAKVHISRLAGDSSFHVTALQQSDAKTREASRSLAM